jgi:hypothetical protein
LTVTAGVAASGLTATGAFAADDVQTVTLTTSATNAHISLGAGSTFLNTADKLTTLTINADGDDSSDITVTASGAGAAAAALTSVTVTADNGADVTVGAIDAQGASITTVSLTSSFTGSDITMSGLGLDGTNITSIANITASAVAGATITISNIEATTVGQMTLSGAGTFTINGSDMDITTLEMINAQSATGTTTIVMNSLGSATIVNLGTGTNTYTASSFADTVNLASGGGTDTVQAHNMDTNQNAIVVNNFQKGSSASDVISVSGTNLEGTTFLASGVDLQDGNGADMGANANMTIKEITAATTLAAGDDVMIMVGATFANTDAVETALEAGGSMALTTGTRLAADDEGFFVVYSDGTDAYLALAVAPTRPAAAAIASGELTVDNIVKLSGISSISSGDFANGDFFLAT